MTAARQGLEPRYHGPKPCVLPLDDRAILHFFNLCTLMTPARQ